jgi:hypothetical protein
VAKDEMFAHTDTTESPWWVVNGDVKRTARLNCISHLLSMVPYEDVTSPPLELEPRPPSTGAHVRPPIDAQSFVPQVY